MYISIFCIKLVTDFIICFLDLQTMEGSLKQPQCLVQMFHYGILRTDPEALAVVVRHRQMSTGTHVVQLLYVQLKLHS